VSKFRLINKVTSYRLFFNIYAIGEIILVVIMSLNLVSCISTKQLESPPTKVESILNESNKDSNFIKANEWMVETFDNAESVIQFTDKEAGIVKGKYVMKEGVVSTSAYVPSTSDCYAIITLRVKDNACRIEIDAPNNMYTQTAYGVEYGFTPAMFEERANKLIADFKANMHTKSANDIW
jgi:hypothetical protein